MHRRVRLERTQLMSYAMNFSAFLINSKIGNFVNKIILFGSVARGDFNEKSDIDIFVDTSEEIEEDVEKLLKLFKSSQTSRMWRLKGVKNEISAKVGKLEEWTLNREIISSGVILYGKYLGMLENAKYYLLVRINVKEVNPSKQVRIWRELYGYTQKVGKKKYVKKGIVTRSGGQKIGKGLVIVPMEKRYEMMDFLKKNKLDFIVHEIWSDTL